MNYKAYLQGEHWKLMRRLRLEVDNEQCAVCGSKNYLNVHHKTYERIGVEKLADLITLCRECHAKYHNKLESGNFNIKKIVPNYHQNKKEFPVFQLEEKHSKIILKNDTLEIGKLSIDGKQVQELPGQRMFKINKIDTGLHEFIFKYNDQEIKKVEMIKENEIKEISFNYSKKDMDIFFDEIFKISRYNSLEGERLNTINKNIEVKGIIPILEERDILNTAIQYKNIELVNILLDKGYNINRKTTGNTTPLDQAALNRNEKIFDLLLKKGAIPTEKTLEIAVQRFSKEKIESLLIEYNINPSDDAVISSVHSGEFQIIKLLLSKGGNINSKDKAGNTLLMRCLSMKRLDVIKFLLEKGCEKTGKNNIGDTPFLLSLSHSMNEDIPLYLLENGFDVLSKNSNGENALLRACSKNFETVIKKLLDYPGINVDQKSNFGETALMRAVVHCSKEISELILAKGCNINVKDSQGNTPLNKVIQTNKYDNAKLLLNHKININSVNNQGNTPLLEAINYSRIDIIKLLLEYGVDKNIKNEITNVRPIDAANKRRLVEVLDVLK